MWASKVVLADAGGLIITAKKLISATRRSRSARRVIEALRDLRRAQHFKAHREFDES
jgi:hypothetical protein